MRRPVMQEYDTLEFYAGSAAFTRVMRLGGLKAARFDLLYGPDEKGKPGNKKHGGYMDLMSPSGLAFLCLN